MSVKSFYIPNGPKDLEPLFPGVDFEEIQSYYIEVLEGATVIATGTINQLDGECCSDKVRIRFLNYLGAVDAINFKVKNDEHETKSDSKRVSTSYPLVKSQHTIGRFNVKANNTLTLSTTDYGERDNEWIQELFDSPLAWIEWTGIQGQSDDFIPVVIQDAKFFKVKEEDRFINEVVIQVIMSNEKFVIRN